MFHQKIKGEQKQNGDGGAALTCVQRTSYNLRKLNESL